ncbi:MAG: hypothetical protein ACFFB0_21535, partial [Promethearchaeota archaeon]
MEEDPQKLVNLANKRFSEVIGDGFKLFFRNFGYIIIPFAILGILSIFLKILLLTELESYIAELGRDLVEKMESTPDISNLYIIEFLQFLIWSIFLFVLQTLIGGRIGGIITVISMCSVSTFLYKKYENGEADFISSFKSSFNKRILLVILLIGIGFPLGIFFFLIPSIIIYGFYIFLIFTYNMQDIENPISKAHSIAKGSFWRLIVIALVYLLSTGIINLIYSSIFNLVLDLPSPRNFEMRFLYQILSNIIFIIFSPLLICLLTCFFSKLKAQKELDQKF